MDSKHVPVVLNDSEPTAVGQVLTVEDLDISGDYGLIQDSQDITATLESIGLEGDYGFLLYKPEVDSNGDMVGYSEVWASEYSVPYLYRTVTRIA